VFSAGAGQPNRGAAASGAADRAASQTDSGGSCAYQRAGATNRRSSREAGRPGCRPPQAADVRRFDGGAAA
jgi:hypothetical protein